MLKLYQRDGDKVKAYHEAWAHGKKIIEHWGALGQRGETRTHVANAKVSEDENLRQILGTAIAKGFEPIEIDDHAVLIIAYSIDGMGTKEDLAKRHSVEARMNETLGWTGLGHCDGGSIGSGSMEVCCLVVNFEIAKKVIEKELKGTELENYSSIYNERSESSDT